MSVFRYSEKAHGYLGNTDRAMNGDKCLPWNNPVFLEFFGLKAADFPDKDIPGAVCRNPVNNINTGLTDKGPWCFTGLIDKPNYMSSCDIPLRGK